MTRLNQVLLIVFVIQLVLAIGLNLPSDSTNDSVRGPLLTDYMADSVDELRITDNNGEQLVLAKVEGEWVMPEADNYPVRAENIEDVLKSIAEINTNRLIARNPTSHNRLEVKDDNFQRQVEILQEDRTYTLFVGTSAGASATHVRLNEDDTVYLTGSLTAWNVPATISRWVETLYFTQPREDIVQVMLENENGEFEFVKNEDEWTYIGLDEDEVFDTNSINSLLSNISSVRMTRPIGKSFNIAEPLATVTLKVEETIKAEETTPEVTPEPGESDISSEDETIIQTLTLQLGQQIEDSTDFALTSSESEYYIQVNETFANTLLNINHDNLLLVETEEETNAGATLDDSE